MIKYIDRNGKNRNYFPDFYVEEQNNKYLIECKPESLFTSVDVLLKKEAAEKYCESMGLTYKLIDPGKLSDEEILKLYVSKHIQFVDRYDIKWKQKYMTK